MDPLLADFLEALEAIDCHTRDEMDQDEADLELSRLEKLLADALVDLAVKRQILTEARQEKWGA